MIPSLSEIYALLVLAAGEGAAPMGDPMAAADGKAAANGDGGNGGIFGLLYSPFGMILIVFAFVYFAMIRPQQQRQSEMADLLNNLKVNDKIYTRGGILGTITNISKEDEEVEVRIDDKTNTKIRVLRSCIAGLDAEKDKDAEKEE